MPSVLFVTAKRAYLNRGVFDGLAPGQSIQLVRQGRAMGTCVVETAFDHQATCMGAHPRAGVGGEGGNVVTDEEAALRGSPVHDRWHLLERDPALFETIR